MFYLFSKIFCVFIILILSFPVNGQIGAGSKPVEQPKVEYQYRQPTAYEIQLELQRRQALYDRNYNYVVALKENVNKLIQDTNDRQFHYEMNVVLKQLDYFLENDLSLLTDKINSTQKYMGKSIKRYNKRVKKLERKRKRRERKKRRRGW